MQCNKHSNFKHCFPSSYMFQKQEGREQVPSSCEVCFRTSTVKGKGEGRDGVEGGKTKGQTSMTLGDWLGSSSGPMETFTLFRVGKFNPVGPSGTVLLIRENHHPSCEPPSLCLPKWLGCGIFSLKWNAMFRRWQRTWKSSTKQRGMVKQKEGWVHQRPPGQ